MFNVLESDRNADERKINNSNERKKRRLIGRRGMWKVILSGNDEI